MVKIKMAVQLLRDVVWQPWARIALAILALDGIVSFVVGVLQPDTPDPANVQGVIRMSFGLLTVWQWALLVAVVAFAATFEVAFKQRRTMAAVSAPGARGAALLRLTQLRESGVVLRNNTPTGSSLRDWIQRTRDWMDEVAVALGPVNDADSRWFLTLDTFPQTPRVRIPRLPLSSMDQRAEFATHFCQHDYRLARLDGLLRKYGVGAP